MGFNVELSELAREDIVRILAYTLQRYGDDQRQSYSDALDDAINAVAANPNLGHPRPDMPPFYKAFPLQQHILVYILRGDTVFVARLLHGQMDFRKQL